MKMVVAICASSLLAAASIIAAGPAAPYLAIENLHMRSGDPAKARDWWVNNLGAEAPPNRSPNANYSGVRFGKISIAIVKTDTPKPSEGSSINHIGLSFPDLEAKMKELQAAGVTVVAPLRDVEGVFKMAFIEDPWGVKVELVQDADTLGFHHVHLAGPDPVATLKWYEDMIGGQRGKLKGRIEGLRYDDVWLLASKSAGPTEPSYPRALLSVGWAVKDVTQAAAALKARGAKVAVEPVDAGSYWYTFFEDPNGARVELMQHK